MNVEELMLGDWVYGYDGEWKPICVKQIMGFHPSIVAVHTYGYQPDQIKPIPITPEILEKNGFLYKNGVWMWLESKGKIYISHLANKWSVEVKNELARKDDLGRADLVSFLRDWAENVYVHELQHAIRLAGIDKEIII